MSPAPSFQRQTTIAEPAMVRGLGLHSGSPVSLGFEPAPAGAGVAFRRNGEIIPADVRLVSQTQLGTRLENGTGIAIQTVEHVLAALAIADIDNILIDLDNIETPAGDGSAEPFVEAIERAGVALLDAPRRVIVVTDEIVVRDGDRFVLIEPFDGSVINIGIDFEAPAIGRQAIEIDLADRFVMRRRLARARTFCRLRDIEQMRLAGFGKGGSLDNAIVVDEARILNGTGLRDPQEFVLHKALDLLGDFRLLGAPFLGRVRAYKPGHDLNTRAVRALLDTESAHVWRAAGLPSDAARFA